ncbi:MAG TPA: DUF2779 domain-containing protein, partial [Oligoflexia bacterium]|nr:DUF2779 domain-containing protein [Oligoflexia bacterium]
MLTKSKFLAGDVCPKRLWLSENRPELAAPASEAEKRRAEQGRTVTELAREYFPSGVLISAVDSSAAIAETKEAIANGATVLFEAAFSTSDVLARADIIEKTPAGWHLIEVKS